MLVALLKGAHQIPWVNDVRNAWVSFQLFEFCLPRPFSSTELIPLPVWSTERYANSIRARMSHTWFGWKLSLDMKIIVLSTMPYEKLSLSQLN
jgi:hypothetical protein